MKNFNIFKEIWKFENQKIRKLLVSINFYLFRLVSALFFIFAFLFLHLTIAAAPSELKELINQKSHEFQEINGKIKENQKEFEKSQNQSQNLKQEINKIDNNIQQVNLGTRLSEIAIDKLSLEIDSLEYDIDDAKKLVYSKKEAIEKIIQEFQQKDKESLLVIFLKNKSLEKSVFEVQNLIDLNNGLSVEVADLINTENILSNKLDETTDKKQTTEKERENLKNKKTILAGLKGDKQILFQQTKNQEKIYQKIISDLEKKQTAIAFEIEKMEEELRLKIDSSALPSKRSGVLAMPISGIMSQGYGATAFARSGGYRGKWHNGVDFGATIGTPVFSAENGEVIAVGNQDNYCYHGAYGKFIVVEHENNLTTLYAHFSLQTAKVGDKIKRGDLLGYVGRTGYATGPHLHFTVYASQTFRMGSSKTCGPMPFGGDLNPMDYL